MKRILCLFIAGIMCISIYSCSREEDTYNDPDDDNDDTEYVETEPETEKDPEDDTELEAQYNSALKLLKKEDYEGAYEAFKQCKGYKDADKYLECFVYLPCKTEGYYDSEPYTSIDEYSIDGYVIKNIQNATYDDYMDDRYKKGDLITRTYDYVFDDDGKMIKETRMIIYNDSEPDSLGEFEYFYDDHGRLIGKKQLDSFMDREPVLDQTFYEDGLLVKLIEGSTTREYEYDDSKNLIREISKDEDGKVFTDLRYEYEDGKIIKEVFEGAMGNYLAEYSYNSDGLLTQLEYSSDETHFMYDCVYCKISYSYTDFGGVKRIDANFDGKLITCEVYYTGQQKISAVNGRTKSENGEWEEVLTVSIEYNSLGLFSEQHYKTVDSYGVIEEKTIKYSDYVLCYSPYTFNERGVGSYDGEFYADFERFDYLLQACRG